MYRSIRRFLSVKGRNGHCLVEDRRGVTAIEFSMVALPFFTLAFGIIEIGLAHFANRMVDNAVVEASRLIRTGQAESTNLSAAGFKTQICGFMPSFMCDEDRIYVEIQSVPDFSDATSLDSMYDEEGELRDDMSYDIGTASEIVVVNVIYKWPMASAVLQFDNGDHGTDRHLTSTMVFRNEPWE
jgi:hypothetical protein